ncbi:MAG: tRNA dihydrouridine synthase DusB [Clostridia bacterium]|nr:tRNA dihydrouridine synthase DusB [Clostridia bacterium]
MKIGDITLKNNVFLAPMAGVTDLPFRYICNKYGGVEYTPTEMVSAKGLVYNDKKTHKIMDGYIGENPRVIQIFGSEPEVLKEVVLRLNEYQDVDIIDINMGCPAPKIVKNGDGSKLLENLEKVEEIIKTVTEVSKKPITIKTRKGYYKDKPTAIQVAKICEKYKVAAICIHGRSKEEYYGGKADWDIIKEVKENVTIPVIANGDVMDIASAKEILEYTKADAIMIGRAAFGNPWIFKDVLQGVHYEVSKEEKLEAILEHIELATQRERESVAIPKLRKHIAWYLKGMKDASVARQKINQAETKQEVIQIITGFFGGQSNEQNSYSFSRTGNTAKHR